MSRPISLPPSVNFSAAQQEVVSTPVISAPWLSRVMQPDCPMSSPESISARICRGQIVCVIKSRYYTISAGFNFALIELQPIQRICAQKSFALPANSVCSDGNNFTFTSLFAVRLGNCSEEGNFERIDATRFLLVVGVCLLDWKYWVLSDDFLETSVFWSSKACLSWILSRF
jgi:hypothetical protein